MRKIIQRKALKSDRSYIARITNDFFDKAKGLDNQVNLKIKSLQQLLIKPTTRRVAGRSPAIGFIFLFVAGLKANCCSSFSTSLKYYPKNLLIVVTKFSSLPNLG